MKNSIRHIITLIVLLSLCGKLTAQHDFKFKHLGAEEGFPQSTVNCIIQDAGGFMWFGTQDGLVRYDGYNFKTYRPDRENKNSIANGYINDIKEDATGMFLWAATQSGISRFEKATGKFENYNPGNAGSINVYSICIDEWGKVWYGAENGLFAFQPSDWVIRNKKDFGSLVFNGIDTLLRHHVTKVVQAQGNVLFISSGNVLWLKDKNNHFDILENLVPLTNKLNNTKFFPFVGAFSNNEVSIVNVSSVVPDSLAKSLKMSIVSIHNLYYNIPDAFCADKDDKGNTWVGTINGLWFIPAGPGQKAPVQIKYNPAVKSSISSDIILSLYRDRNGIVWVGTSNGGVNFYNPATSLFKNITDNKTSIYHLNNKYIFGVEEDSKGDIWIGSLNGLHHLKINKEKHSAYFENVTDLTLFTNQENNSNSLSNNRIGKIFSSGDSLFIGTMGGGLDIYDLASGRFTNFTAANSPPGTIRNNFIQSIFRDKKSMIWICTKNGPVIWNSHKKQLESPGAWANSKVFADLFTGLEDDMNIYWFGGMTGVITYNPATGELHTFAHKDGDKTSLAYNSIGTITEDRKHRIWIGTIGGGLSLFNRQNNTFQTFTETDGLANNNIFGAIEDDKGNLWLSTDKGISMFNPETKKFRNFGPGDGLPFSEFAQHSYAKTKNGWMFFGGEDGVVCFNPKEVTQTRPSAPVILLDLKINYESVGEGLNGTALAHLNQLELNYKQKAVSFEFGALNYTDPLKTRYAYKLEGFDDAWHYTDARQRFATYTNLPYGHFTFIVKSTDEYGNWTENPLILKIRTVPPFWLTWWFIALMIVLLMTIIIYIVSFFSRLRLQRKLQKLELANSLQSERERISRELHDNVGSQLTYIISKLDSAKQKAILASQSSEIEGNLENIGMFARNTMQQLRESIWAMNKDSFTLEEFEMKLRDYVGKYLDAENGIAWKIEVNPAWDVHLSPAMVINLFRIIQEAINNSIKHANASEIKIRLSSNHKNLVVSIMDNGQGISAKEESDTSMHYGLQNMQKRAEEMNGILNIESIPAKGTTIQLNIPL